MEENETDDKIRELLYLKKDIDSLLFRYKEELNEMKQFPPTIISSDTILIDFSRRISLTTRAPPLWKPGLPLDISFGHGPYPQLEELAGGYLRKYQIENIQNNTLKIQSNASTKTNLIEHSTTSDSNDAMPIQSTVSALNVTITDVFSHLGIPYDKSSSSSYNLFTKSSLNKSKGLSTERRPEMRKEAEPIIKKSRQFSLSFGLSDSEDEDDENKS